MAGEFAAFSWPGVLSSTKSKSSATVVAVQLSRATMRTVS